MASVSPCAPLPGHRCRVRYLTAAFDLVRRHHVKLCDITGNDVESAVGNASMEAIIGSAYQFWSQLGWSALKQKKLQGWMCSDCSAGIDQSITGGCDGAEMLHGKLG